jgi:hypothetical protein
LVHRFLISTYYKYTRGIGSALMQPTPKPIRLPHYA